MALIAMLATNDFEDTELKYPYDRLRDAGYDVVIVGPKPGETITGKRRHARVVVDRRPENARIEEFDALVIPGGYSPDKLRLDEASVRFVRDFVNSGKTVAAVCHAAQLLISAEVVRGRTLTCWPSVAVDVKNAGGHYVDQPVVVDGNLITSRRPDDLPEFVSAIIAALEETEQKSA